MHILTKGYWNKAGITSNSRLKARMEKDIEATVMAEYNRRKESFNEPHGRLNNVLDIMIAHNIKAENEGRTEDILNSYRIVGNTGFFFLAGYVTSVDSMISGFTYIAERQDWCNKCIEGGLSSTEEILENQPLQFAIQEI